MKKSSEKLPFNFNSKKPLEVNFSGLDLSSDAGLLLVKQAEENLKIAQGISTCLEDDREQHKVKHSLFQLVSQRIYQIVAGYEDTNDSNYLRHDPIFKIICDKIPEMGAELLASQPTISRLENGINQQEIKRIRRFFVDKFLQNYPSPPEQIVLDIDGFDAYTHGHQQLSLFHGYYGHQIYFPVLINEAKSGYPLLLHLRPGNSHAGKGVLGLLRWLFWRLRKAWPDVNIILRGDGGFSLPEIINLCEKKDVKYVFGFSSNAVLKRKINYLIDLARLEYFRTQEKARLFDDVYYAAKSWEKPRRVVMKAEWLEKGGNPRFLVTNLETEAQELYDNFYVERGATSEHRIKELKLGINADRLSCHKFIVNQFRLFLCQAAYILMLELRASAEGTRLGMAQVSRLRETIIKIAARVTVSMRRTLVELAAHCPFHEEILLMVQRLSSGQQLIFS
ncbi:MAG: IS1380 family transposase [Crocosphaera sp.]|uniref:IS1380 family transposase n=1 Tax=Crocosphaera sp. TaxID=2729996 RepID=UPI00258C4866|nr:IS1380 family transposase [Crocosphaera sp.]MCH2248090.1 IS1380 family transposase [Crocosphaera sp.]